MNHISQVNIQTQTAKIQPSQTQRTSQHASQSKQQAQSQEVDRAEISELGRLLGLSQEWSDVRTEKVAQIRAQIEQDEQAFINDRIDATVDRILDNLL